MLRLINLPLFCIFLTLPLQGTHELREGDRFYLNDYKQIETLLKSIQARTLPSDYAHALLLLASVRDDVLKDNEKLPIISETKQSNKACLKNVFVDLINHYQFHDYIIYFDNRFDDLAEFFTLVENMHKNREPWVAVFASNNDLTLKTVIGVNRRKQSELLLFNAQTGGFERYPINESTVKNIIGHFRVQENFGSCLSITPSIGSLWRCILGE